ncbi:hypothetical protein WJX73_009495 [Symbiochloris irregularis]|uniref:Uncharacterized protein n=1 Tax=Symbiochloris irregularis TaxID=706552 RepID=A0AAW1PRG2_9CHLO
MKQLGLKKPDFLPDFGQEKRKAVLDRFFTNLDHDTYNEILADNFTLQERRPGAKAYNKKDYINLALDTVKPSIPDFTWTHATNGSKDKSDFSLVTVQATGRFTGKPFVLPGLPQLEPTGEKFLLAEERQMVKVEDGKIVKIEVLPQEGAGPRALYKALGGKA